MARSFPSARNLAEVIDALYRESAPPRDHVRLIELITHHLNHAYAVGYRDGKQPQQ